MKQYLGLREFNNVALDSRTNKNDKMPCYQRLKPSPNYLIFTLIAL